MDETIIEEVPQPDKWVLVTGGKVVQQQPNEQAGFLPADEHVSIGWLWDGVTFSAPIESTAKQMARELTALADAYKSDIALLNDQLVGILMADGADEESRKAVIRTRFTTRKDKYLADVAAVKAKYA